MSNKDWLSRPISYLAIVIYILAGFSTLAATDRLASMLFDEDKYFENLGALGFFAAALLFFYGFINTFKSKPVNFFFRIRQALLLGLAFLFFFGAGEEISWGQRIFNIQTPDALAAINAQQETNIHNIDLFEYQIHFETVFDLFWMFLTIALPLAVKFIKPLGDFVGKFIAVPRLNIGLLFLFNYLCAKVGAIIFQSQYVFSVVPFVQAIQEVKESNYALLFVLVAFDVVRISSEPQRHSF